MSKRIYIVQENRLLQTAQKGIATEQIIGSIVFQSRFATAYFLERELR